MNNIVINRATSIIPDETVADIEGAFDMALDRFASVIRETHITLRDLNGPKGGIDKLCKVQLRLYPRGLAVVSSTGTSYMEAVNTACDKIRQVISKRISKRRSIKQRFIREPYGDSKTYELQKHS
jgi:putative sigma-54 modulation protein